MKIFKTDKDGLTEAAEEIRAGHLVAFATETVYGLGADATNDRAVASIYEAKGRPSFNPLIVHVPSLAKAKEYVTFNDTAERLAATFWPGALTLVLPRVENCPVSRLASAGLETLAIRVPGHKLALEFLKECGRPLAAPSANPSGGISPTKAQHVIDGLEGKIAGVLDGGPCPVGVESTVVGFTENDQPVLLRPGGITREALEASVGLVLSHDADGTTPSPGMLLSHYAPNASVRLNATAKEPGEAYLAFGREYDTIADVNLSINGDLTEATALLFSALHFLDKMNFKRIAVGPIPEIGLGVAINDRLRRAAAPKHEKETIGK
ncbi:L-threonylcarbamoyladenylate synthase [Sneathiella sp. HT1-7]|uniref:L-threonylcarbamoyladenylate synthase n=1 Tax=Sneathiella sp. HT1-7 TaxID=2887192 RepID=UPI001D15A309|nr:L-threonylcarbamoyladenylate synthase [Sneathiella sp. HT1-7]MCC3305650.1 threonylcarbamoyl-AMP synthase [Sneathiella sp. HT1-7]